MDSNIDPDTANTVHLNDLSPWESTPTLTYLTNPIYKTDVSKKQKTDSEVAADEATDRRFYRKRIMELTRSMFKKPHPDRELREMFDDYIRTCVTHLKTADIHDILQKDYPPDISNNTLASNNIAELDIQKATVDAMGNIPKETISLDAFVTRKNTVTSTDRNKLPPPLKKTINLKDPALRSKGLKIKSKGDDKKRKPKKKKKT